MTHSTSALNRIYTWILTLRKLGTDYEIEMFWNEKENSKAQPTKLEVGDA
jgi:hypothetical protein